MHDARTGAAPGFEWGRRARPDRRRSYLLSDWRYVFGGRRRRIRRAGDECEAGLDYYPPRALLLVVAILLLNALDAICTIRLVEAGAATELNPFMRALLERDVQLFANLKVAITSGALLFLVVCSNMVVFGRRVKVETLLSLMLGAYLCLVAYHLVLLRIAS